MSIAMVLKTTKILPLGGDGRQLNRTAHSKKQIENDMVDMHHKENTALPLGNSSINITSRSVRVCLTKSHPRKHTSEDYV